MAAHLARRVQAALLRPAPSLGQQQRAAGGGHGKGWWSQGTQERPDGILFGETPLKPGERRKWESWELTWYTTLAVSAVSLFVGLRAKPDTTITAWAHKEAQKELVEEGLLDAAVLRQ